MARFTDEMIAQLTQEVSLLRLVESQAVLNNASRTPFSDIQNGTAITVPKSDLPLIKPKF